MVDREASRHAACQPINLQAYACVCVATLHTYAASTKTVVRLEYGQRQRRVGRPIDTCAVSVGSVDCLIAVWLSTFLCVRLCSWVYARARVNWISQALHLHAPILDAPTPFQASVSTSDSNLLSWTFGSLVKAHIYWLNLNRRFSVVRREEIIRQSETP